MKFCIVFVVMLAVYGIVYYIGGVRVQKLSALPLVSVGLATTLHLACAALQFWQIRNGSAWRYDVSGWTLSFALVFDAALVALTRFDVKLSMYQDMPDSQTPGQFGQFSYDHIDIDEMTRERLAVIKQDVNITTQIFQLLLLYFVLFVLSPRQSCFVGVLAPLVYCFIGTVFGTSKLMPNLSFGELGFQLDLTLMIIGVGIMVLAKVLIDRSKLKLFEVMESQREQIVTEKVLRCEAEFAKEAVLSTTVGHDDKAQAHHHSTFGFDLRSNAPSHVETAPSVLAPLVPTGADACAQGSGDCLPSHTMVWTESAKLPQLLSSLAPGERILCYDTLSKSMTYAAIEKLTRSTNTEWVKLWMQDGSMLEVTTDHPVVVQPEDASLFRERCMRAGELEAGRDRLLMLKMVWVPISDVRHASSALGEDGSPPAVPPMLDSITISVEQRERYEIFVTTGDKNGNPGPAIAVGSSDRSIDDHGKWRKKNTFIDYSAAEQPGLKRSKSDPGLSKLSSGLLQSASSINTTTLLSTVPKSDVSSMAESGCTSTVSRASTGDDCVVKIGRAPYDDPSSNVASLAAMAHLTSKGIPSAGSDHPMYACTSPCSFQFAGLLNSGRYSCKAGPLCEYCHDTQHQPYISSKLRKLSRRPKHLAKTARRIEQI
jgi:hypothetical protein